MVFVTRFGNEGDSRGMEVDLTPEQEARLKDGKFWSLGYVAPEQVRHYCCENCGNVADVIPPVRAVVDLRTNTEVIGLILYDCGKCKKTIVSGYVPEEFIKTIPLELIEYDATGDYVTPTPEAIEEQLEKVEAIAAKGNSMNFDQDNLSTLRRWAAKIGYTLPEDRIAALPETCRNAYIARAPEFIGYVVNQLRGWGDPDLPFSLSPLDPGLSSYGEIACYVDDVLELAPVMEVPDDLELCSQVAAILGNVAKMYERAQAEILGKIEELRGMAMTLEEQAQESRGDHLAWLERVPGLREHMQKQNSNPLAEPEKDPPF
ncbi:hypothetical protein KY329_00480 [Candidatus Woesearchaeota archaeon]|nr:hypothetical protein [Candidatus Woesearchaeota archaeon]